jgi:regulator of replication initiation timing
MKRIGELNKENALLKLEVERLKNNVAYLDKQLDKQLDEEDDGGDSYNHPHAFGQ